TGNLTLTATGGINVHIVSGSLTAAQLKVSNPSVIQNNIQLSTTDGFIELDGDSFDPNTANDNLTILAGGNITFGDKPVSAANMLLQGSSIIGGTARVDAIVTDRLTMFSGLDIGAATDPLIFSASHLVTVSNRDQFLATTTATNVEFALGEHISLLGGAFYVADQMIAFSQLTVGQFATLGGNGFVFSPDIQVKGAINP